MALGGRGGYSQFLNIEEIPIPNIHKRNPYEIL